MIPLANAPHQKPPLRTEEARIQRGIITLRRETQQIDIRLRGRQVIIIAGLIDQRKDAIGDPDGVEDQEESARLELDPFHVGLAGETLAPAGEVEEFGHIGGLETADDEFGVEGGFDAVFGPPEGGVGGGLGLGHGVGGCMAEV